MFPQQKNKYRMELKGALPYPHPLCCSIRPHPRSPPAGYSTCTCTVVAYTHTHMHARTHAHTYTHTHQKHTHRSKHIHFPPPPHHLMMSRFYYSLLFSLCHTHKLHEIYTPSPNPPPLPPHPLSVPTPHTRIHNTAQHKKHTSIYIGMPLSCWLGFNILTQMMFVCKVMFLLLAGFQFFHFKQMMREAGKWSNITEMKIGRQVLRPLVEPFQQGLAALPQVLKVTLTFSVQHSTVRGLRVVVCWLLNVPATG